MEGLKKKKKRWEWTFIRIDQIDLWMYIYCDLLAKGKIKVEDKAILRAF